MKKTKGADPETDFARVVDRFAGKKICVVGDIIADVNIIGKPYRLSREAPVIVVKYEGTQVFPGSAGNTINNLLALGAHVYPVGFIGKDSMGNKLIDYFARYKTVDTMGLIRVDKPTITKTRILAGDTHTSKQQVIRIDREDEGPYRKSEKTALMETLARISPHVDAIVVSDYGHGVVSGKVIDYMKIVAQDKAVIGDSRYNLKKFSGFTLITPNESEAYGLSGLDEEATVEEVGKKILASMKLAALLITRGNEGMTLFRQKGIIDHIPISGKDDVTDVTGAGDTVCAAAALAIASGADFYTASRIANFAAGVVVMKRGTATVNPDELKNAVAQGA